MRAVAGKSRFSIKKETCYTTLAELLETGALTSESTEEEGIQWEIGGECDEGQLFCSSEFDLPNDKSEKCGIVAYSPTICWEGSPAPIIQVPFECFQIMTSVGKNVMTGGRFSLAALHRICEDLHLSESRFAIAYSIVGYDIGNLVDDIDEVERKVDAANEREQQLQNYLVFRELSKRGAREYPVQCRFEGVVARRGTDTVQGNAVILGGMQWTLKCELRNDNNNDMDVKCFLECKTTKKKSARVKVWTRIRKNRQNLAGTQDYIYCNEDCVELQYAGNDSQKCALFTRELAKHIHFAVAEKDRFSTVDYAHLDRLKKGDWKSSRTNTSQLRVNTVDPVTFECDIQFIEEVESKTSSGAGSLISKSLPRKKNSADMIVKSVRPSVDFPADESSTKDAECQTDEHFESRFHEDFDYVCTLGQGGFGIALSCTNKIDHHSFAVKRVAVKNSYADLEEVTREARVMVMLNHPFIVRYYNVWVERLSVEWLMKRDAEVGIKDAALLRLLMEESSSGGHSSFSLQSLSSPLSSMDGFCAIPSKNETQIRDYAFVFIQMELCPKTSLYDWIRKRNEERRKEDCDAKKMRVWFMQLVSAVRYIHRRGLIHRDLKPSNILFSEDFRALKIADLGLAKHFHEDESMSNRGTQIYMSIEMLCQSHYDQKVDIYALGLIFAEMVCLFEDEKDHVKSLLMLRSGQSPPQLRPFPKEAKFVTWLTQREAAERPTSEQLFACEYLKVERKMLRTEMDDDVQPSDSLPDDVDEETLDELRVECDVLKILKGLSQFEVISLLDDNTILESASSRTTNWNPKYIDTSLCDFEAKEGKVAAAALRKLTKPLSSWLEIKRCLGKYTSGSYTWKGIENFFENVLDDQTAKKYLSTVVPFMATLALSLPKLLTKKIPILERCRECGLLINEQQAATILANAFFCTISREELSKWLPSLSFRKLFDNSSALAAEKLRCVFSYFEQIQQEPQSERLLLYRRQMRDMTQWCNSRDAPLQELFVSSDGRIEDEGRGMLQVIFANCILGAGVFGYDHPYQEEIRFLTTPELLIAMLVCERMMDNEAIIVSGVRKFSDYSGYARTFKWRPAQTFISQRYSTSEVVAMDPLQNIGGGQFTMESVNRELNKALAGFRFFEGSTVAIATGNWGCGIRKGDVQLRSLIQLMAASAATRTLHYFAFGDATFCSRLRRLHELLKAKNVSVGELYGLISDYCAQRTVEGSFESVGHFQSAETINEFPSIFDFMETKLSS